MTASRAEELVSLLRSLAQEGTHTRTGLIQLRTRILPLAADPARLDSIFSQVFASHEKVSRAIAVAQMIAGISDEAGTERMWREWAKAQAEARSYFAELRGNIEELERAAGEKEGVCQLQAPKGQQ